jgi:sugar-specific transcriptional regulator TrmB
MISKIEVKKNIYTSLKELGLTESEANLYATSLALGPATIASLAEHLNISRPNVYKGIAGLERHGLAKFSERKKYTRTFVVEPPTVVLEKLRKKREIVADLDQTLVGAMPDLLAQYHQGETPTKIKIFEGREQYIKAFFSVLEETKESLFFGSATDAINLLSWEKEREWIQEKVKRGIRSKALFLPSKEAETLMAQDKEHLRETRILKGVTPFVSSFQIFGSKAFIWQPKATLVLLIEDQCIVEMLRSIFTTLWEQSTQEIGG